MELVQNLWAPDDQWLRKRLKKDIISGPKLARLESYRKFYTRTYCSKDGMVAVILQLDDSVDSRKT